MAAGEMKRFYTILGVLGVAGLAVIGYLVMRRPTISIPANVQVLPADTAGFRGYFLGSDSAPIEVRTRPPLALARSPAYSSNADLPIPASPRTISAPPRLARSSVSWSRSCSSASRPIRSVTACDRAEEVTDPG